MESFVFQKYGFTTSNVDILINELINLIRSNDYNKIIENDYGVKYIINGNIQSIDGLKTEITTIWFIEKGDTIPYFITAYPRKKR